MEVLRDYGVPIKAECGGACAAQPLTSSSKDKRRCAPAAESGGATDIQICRQKAWLRCVLKFSDAREFLRLRAALSRDHLLSRVTLSLTVVICVGSAFTAVIAGGAAAMAEIPDGGDAAFKRRVSLRTSGESSQ